MEFYSLPNVSSAPAQGPRISRETLRIGVIVILVIIVTTIGFIVFKKRSGANPAVSEVKQAIAACDTADCATVLAISSARDANDSSICQLVKGDGVIECVKQYAYDKLDPSACGRLKGGDYSACFSNAQYLLAASKKEISLCESITDENLKNICFHELGTVYANENRCSESGSFKDTCQKIVDDRIAIAKQIGPALCEPFLTANPETGTDSAAYSTCLYALDNVDLDGDGLVIRKEIEVGTDNQNKDTDGDGFDDGTEVRGGYNPLGA